MKSLGLAFALAFVLSSVWARDPIFVLLLTEEEFQANATQSLALQEMYCLDPVLPEEGEPCETQVLAPVEGHFSDTKITEASVEFEHPSRGTKCRLDWKTGGPGEYSFGCEGEVEDASSAMPDSGLPDNSTSGFGGHFYTRHVFTRETCRGDVHAKQCYGSGPGGYAEERPTAVIRISLTGCVTPTQFRVRGKTASRVAEVLCRYDERRRCRPLTDRQRQRARGRRVQ